DRRGALAPSPRAVPAPAVAAGRRPRLLLLLARRASGGRDVPSGAALAVAVLRRAAACDADAWTARLPSDARTRVRRHVGARSARARVLALDVCGHRAGLHRR